MAAAAVTQPQRATTEFDTAALYREHAGEVSRWVRALAGPTAEIEDLVQDVFVTAHHKQAEFRRASTPKTWLFGIANNLVMRHRRVQLVRGWLGGSAKDVGGHVMTDSETLAPELLQRWQARARVYTVLEKLNEKQRTVIILFELEGRPAAEIAELFGVTSNVVFVWLYRARAQFHKHLEQLEQTEGAV